MPLSSDPVPDIQTETKTIVEEVDKSNYEAWFDIKNG